MSGPFITKPLSRAFILSSLHQKFARRLVQNTMSGYASSLGVTRIVERLGNVRCRTPNKCLQPSTMFRKSFLNANASRLFCSSANEEVLKEKNSEDKVSAPKKTEITYDELLAFVELEKKFLFDVRDATEIKGTGTIPSAINIPLTKLKSSMVLPDEEFHQTYKVKKPTLDESNLIVFYGLSSVKSSAALEILQKMGYKKARHYPGGFEEWKQKMTAKK